jgi:hypothetical protein
MKTISAARTILPVYKNESTQSREYLKAIGVKMTHSRKQNTADTKNYLNQGTRETGKFLNSSSGYA